MYVEGGYYEEKLKNKKEKKNDWNILEMLKITCE